MNILKSLALLWVLSVITWADNGCELKNKELITKLESKYNQELKSLVGNKAYYKEYAVCKDIPNSSKMIMVLSYNTKAERSYLKHSIIISTIDKKSSTVLQSYFHKNIMMKNNLRDFHVEIKPKLYANLGKKITFGIIIGVNSLYMATKKLFIYEEEKDTFKVLAHDILLYKRKGYSDDEQSILKCTYSPIDRKDLVFKCQYDYAIKKDKYKKLQEWSVELEPNLYVYRGGKYVEENITPVFNLEEIEQQSKKGLHFRELVLNALVFEMFDYSKDDYIPAFNNIAFYFYKHKFYKESIYLLEKIVNHKPKRAIAHLNLADSYWESNKKYKASTHYNIYKKLNEKESKKVLQRAIERGNIKTNIYDLNLSRGFIQVHKEVQEIHPILLENSENIKAVAILPWLQKKILSTSRGKIVKVFTYENDNILNFLYFVIFGDKLELYLFNENDKEKLIDSFKINRDYTSVSNFEYQNYFIDEEGLDFTFDLYDNKKGEFTLNNYRYDFKTEKMIDTIHNIKELPILKFTGHNGDEEVSNDYDGKFNTISYQDKILFKIKTFEDGFVIGDIDWSPDDSILYFDNHGIMMACIWRYDFATKELSKIIPEHEAEHPYSFNYKGKEYVIYVEGQNIKVAREK